MRYLSVAMLFVFAGCGGASEKQEKPAPAPTPAPAPSPDPHADMGGMKPAGGRPWLGANPDYSASDRMKISSIAEGSPAEKAGLKAGEEIEEFDGVEVTDLQDYSQRLFAKRPGDTVTLRVVGGGKKRDVKVTLATKGNPDE